MKKGFTLVEVLVVISVLSLVGVLVLTIFTRSLQGNNKSQILSAIKQNGQSVLENIDKTIRDSDIVVCPVINPPDTGASSANLVVRSGGVYTRYRFIDPSPAINPTMNGLIQQDNPTKQNVQDSDPLREETDPEFVNRICTLVDPMSQTATNILTDTDTQSGVSVESGLFTRSRSAGFKDQVIIKFNLKPGISAPQIDAVSFQTTIQLR